MNDWSHLGAFVINPANNEYLWGTVAIWRYNPQNSLWWYANVGHEHLWKPSSGAFSFDRSTSMWWLAIDDDTDVVMRLDGGFEGRPSSKSGTTGTGELFKGNRMPAGPIAWKIV